MHCYEGTVNECSHVPECRPCMPHLLMGAAPAACCAGDAARVGVLGGALLPPPESCLSGLAGALLPEAEPGRVVAPPSSC